MTTLSTQPIVSRDLLRWQIHKAFSERHAIKSRAGRAILRTYIAAWIMELDVLTGNEDRLYRHLRGCA